MHGCCKDFNHKITYELLVKSVFTVWKIDILSSIRGLLKLKLPSNGQLQSYFSMILVTFYETFQDLLEARGFNDCFRHTFPLLQLFSIFTVKLYRGSTTFHQIDFFILVLIHFRSTLNSAYNTSKAFFKNHFLLYMKGGLPRPIHSVWHQPHSIPPWRFVYSFSMS